MISKVLSIDRFMNDNNKYTKKNEKILFTSHYICMRNDSTVNPLIISFFRKTRHSEKLEINYLELIIFFFYQNLVRLKSLLYPKIKTNKLCMTGHIIMKSIS